MFLSRPFSLYFEVNKLFNSQFHILECSNIQLSFLSMLFQSSFAKCFFHIFIFAFVEVSPVRFFILLSDFLCQNVFDYYHCYPTVHVF